AGGTLICTSQAVQFPTELGLARTVDASGQTTPNFYAPRPLVNAEIVKPEHPVFYGYTEKIIPLKYLGGPLMSVGQADQNAVVARPRRRSSTPPATSASAASAPSRPARFSTGCRRGRFSRWATSPTWRAARRISRSATTRLGAATSPARAPFPATTNTRPTAR